MWDVEYVAIGIVVILSAGWGIGVYQRRMEARIEQLEEILTATFTRLMQAPELNISNYTEDEVSTVNDAVNDVCCELENHVSPKLRFELCVIHNKQNDSREAGLTLEAGD